MNEFEKRIRSRISDLEMLPSRGGRVLAGVSGGADSVCLLLVLAALREDLDFDPVCGRGSLRGRPWPGG